MCGQRKFPLVGVFAIEKELVREKERERERKREKERERERGRVRSHEGETITQVKNVKTLDCKTYGE